MKNIKRDIRIITIADIYERFLLNGYQNISMPNEVNQEAQERLIDGILHNVPMTPIVSTWSLHQKLQKSFYTIVQGKERVEMILHYIESHREEGSSRVILDSLSEEQKETFWHYQIPMHNIITELSDDEMAEFITMYNEMQ